MAEISNPILQKLDGLEARYEEVSTLITDPSVIADQNRYVKLTKEWKDLGDIMNARKRYINCLEGIREAKDILANETDPEMKDMAREELATNEELQPKLEEEIKILLIPKDPEDAKNVQMEIRALEQEATKPASLPVTYLICISVSASRRVGSSLSLTSTKVPWAAIRKSTLPFRVPTSMAR